MPGCTATAWLLVQGLVVVHPDTVNLHNAMHQLSGGLKVIPCISLLQHAHSQALSTAYSATPEEAELLCCPAGWRTLDF